MFSIYKRIDIKPYCKIYIFFKWYFMKFDKNIMTFHYLNIDSDFH